MSSTSDVAALELDELTNDERPNTVRRLVDEVDQAFAQDNWMFLGTREVLPKPYAGAALRHCNVLLREMDEARVEGREATVPVLARAHWETWLVGMYLVCAGEEA